MIEPRYQELERKDISRGESENVDMEARVIAGEALSAASPVYTRTPTMYVDFTMRPGSHLHQPVPEGWNAFVYVVDGEGGRRPRRTTASSSAPATASTCGTGPPGR